jgi:Phosphatidylserine synthase
MGSLPGTGTASIQSPLPFPSTARELVLGSEGEGAPRDLAGESLERPVEDIAVRESAAHALGGVHHERVGFAERQEAQGVVEIAVGEDDGLDGRVPRRLGMQAGKALDLLPDLRARCSGGTSRVRPS